jgi:DNA replication protein DnaC
VKLDLLSTAASVRSAEQPLRVTRWHERIGDPTVADGILDRLVHNAHRIEMRGDAMRKNRGKPNA